MAELPESMQPHRLAVQPYVGTGAYGDSWGAEIDDVPCWIDATRKLVRAPDGSEKTSEATILLSTSRWAQVQPGSLLKLHKELSGPYRACQVIQAKLRTDGGMGAWQHVELAVT